MSTAPGVRSNAGVSVMAAGSGALAASHARVAYGRLYDRFHKDRNERVAVLGVGAARSLGITELRYQPSVFLDDIPFTVIAVIDSADRLPELLLSVVISPQAALAAFGSPNEPRARMLVETELGAAGLVASQSAVALRPESPERFRVISAVDPDQLRTKVSGDINDMILVLAAVCLLIGAVGIANTTLVSVLERVEEIGLRRTLGARRYHVGLQFIAESGFLGVAGGLVGANIGVGLVLLIAVAKNWTAAIEPSTVAMAPGLGLLIGLLAGLHPAIRAARVEPARAMRR
ncbi:ABC transporter permease [Micromonospora sp. NPDC126480]|uniref:ABC transporter permease n=1 Tax=Micromonospora sp. NPDC126480 TaxID=3155312 RepID=UPI003321980E